MTKISRRQGTPYKKFWGQGAFFLQSPKVTKKSISEFSLKDLHYMRHQKRDLATGL